MYCHRLFQRILVTTLLLPLIAVIAGCAGTDSFQPRNGVEWYKVKSYDTLYSIAWRYALDHQDLARWNRLEHPFTIYPGQQLLLNPPPTQVLQARTKSPRPEKTEQQAVVTRPLKSVSPIAPRRSSRGSAVVNWQWPTRGKLLSRFSSKVFSKRGIDIAGKIGQPVQAVADGKIVYSGAGLANYGNLIIVKHSETYLSAYAFNRKSYVSEGQQVKQGEVISEMGENADKRPALHFQIRKNGKPVDPLKYLPSS